jgi:membrane-associated protein
MTWVTQLISQVVESLVAAMAAWGYVIVLAATILENLFIVGSVTPGELLTAAAGFTASQVPQLLNVWVVWALAITGTMIGSNISFWLGHRGGRQLLERFNGRFGITSRRIVAAEEYFRDHGNKTIFAARFVAVFKNFAPVLAGASRMDVWVFELYTLLGAVTYSSLMVAIGFFLGRNFQAGLQIVGAVGWVGFVLVAVVAVVLLLVRRRLNRAEEIRKADEAAAEGLTEANTEESFHRLETALHPRSGAGPEEETHADEEADDARR